MRLSLIYVKMTVAAATVVLTTVAGSFMVHLVHKHHTMQTPSPPTRGETPSMDVLRLTYKWLYPYITHQSPSKHALESTKSIIAGIGGTDHEKGSHTTHTGTHPSSSQTKQTPRSVSSSKAQGGPKQAPVHVPAIPNRTVFAYVPYYAKSVSLKDITHDSSSFSEAADWSFSLQQRGSLQGNPNQALLNYASRHGMHVYASISNGYNRSLTSDVLTSSAARKRLTQQLVHLATHYHYSGVNLDFENIPKSNRREFTAFVSQLADVLHSHGKLLTLAVPAIDTSSREAGYDLSALGKKSDGLVIMAYDYTYLTQPPGPIAPLSWVERVLKFNLQHVPANKLILGVGAYGYEWGGTKAKPLSEKAADAEVTAEHMTQEQNTAAKTPYFTYTAKDGKKHILYYQTSSAIKQLITLARTNHLRGVALWHAGSEDKAVAANLKGYR